MPSPPYLTIFFFNDTAPTEIYTLSLHDALPISPVYRYRRTGTANRPAAGNGWQNEPAARLRQSRSEEHTSELQSRLHLVCRLLLQKKKCQMRKATRSSTTRMFTLLHPLANDSRS